MQKRFGITQSQTFTIMGIIFLVLFVQIAVPFYNNVKQKKIVSQLQTIHSQLLHANRMSSYVTSSDLNDYNTSLEPKEFAQMYFTPYLTVDEICDTSQEGCWSSLKYTDLSKTVIQNKSTYSLKLPNNVVLGFYKNEDGIISILIDISGEVQEKTLGKDIFVVTFYNEKYKPTICETEEYEKYKIRNGLHLGGYDKCGIPHDVYRYEDLYSAALLEGCSKQSKANPKGIGVGSACFALIKASTWAIDKNYPW